MRFVHGLGFAALGAVLITDNCIHQSRVVENNVAHVPGVCVQDLTGNPIESGDVQDVLTVTLEEWEKQLPEYIDRDAGRDYFLNHPILVFLVKDNMNCTHAGYGEWPGQISKCMGLWPIASNTVFLTRSVHGLHCGGLAHELSHILAYNFLHDAEAQHTMPEIWGANGVVNSVRNRLGDCNK